MRLVAAMKARTVENGNRHSTLQCSPGAARRTVNFPIPDDALG